MKLRIEILETQKKECFFIKFNQQEKKIYGGNNVSFTFDKEGYYDLEIIKSFTAKHLPIYLKLIHFLIMPIRGFFCYYFFDSYYDWEEDIEPYCIHAKICLYLDKDQTIYLTYIRSKYKDGKWIKDCLKVKPDYQMNIEHIPNCNSIKNRYFAYVRKALSIIVCSLCIIAFFISMMFCYPSLLCFLSGLGISIFCLIIICLYIKSIYKAYKERLKLEKLFQKELIK